MDKELLSFDRWLACVYDLIDLYYRLAVKFHQEIPWQEYYDRKLSPANACLEAMKDGFLKGG